MAQSGAKFAPKISKAAHIAPRPIHRLEGGGMGGMGHQPGAEGGFVGRIAVLGMQTGQPSGSFRPDFG
jgi:hypothetical protein